MADMTETIIPKSDQMNAEDLLAGPRTFTITRVDVKPGAEQPVSVHLAEFPRVFRPSKTVCRIFVAAWGNESDAYVGQKLTLYRDGSVQWAGKDVGGIRVSHMTNLPRGERMVLPLTITKGKREPFVVEPLAADAPASAPDPVDLIVGGFLDLGVTIGQLEAWLALPRVEWDETNVAALRTLGGQISRGETKVEDEFQAVES